MIKINGKNADKAEGQSLSDCLQTAGFNLSCVVAELNQQIVPKTEYKTTLLKDGDVLEILNFVGGG